MKVKSLKLMLLSVFLLFGFNIGAQVAGTLVLLEILDLMGSQRLAQANIDSKSLIQI